MELELFVSMPEISEISGILFSTFAKFALESLSRLSYNLDMQKIINITIAACALIYANWCDNAAAWMVLGLFAFLMVFGKD